MTKIALCLVAVFALLGTLAAQQSSTRLLLPEAALPEAPVSQLIAEASSPDQDATPAQTQPAQTQPAQTQPSAAPTPAPQTVPQPAPPAQTQAQTPQERRAKAAKELQAQEKQRMLGVIPNFNTVLSGEAEPLTAGQKFHLFFKASVDPFQFVAAGVDAGIEQAQGDYAGYGNGFQGYAKRYGASFADGFDGNFWGNAVLPSLLHQDPRYFRSGQGSFSHRLWYSVISTVRCKGDNGKWQPNYSNVAGNFIGGAISNVYYPEADRGFGLTIQRGFTVTAEGAIGSLAVEFYPDVIRHFANRRKSPAPSQP